MRIVAAGLNHRRAVVEVREKVAYAEAEIPEALRRLQQATGAAECVLLSTCNRVEIYMAHPEPSAPCATIARFFEEDRGAAGLGALLYAHEGLEAILHLFRVAGGLDSMVVGEHEILGQVKRAYLAAFHSGRTGRVLNRLFQTALHVGKAVRAETSIASGQVSVASVAVSLAEKIFGDLGDRRAAILGAGETGELTAATLRDRGVRSFAVVNRTEEHARRVADRLDGIPLPLDRLPEVLAEADILVSCVAAEGLLAFEALRTAAASRQGRPLLVVDIAVPRSVDPSANRIESVYLYDIDDLQSIAAENTARRAREIQRCEAIVAREAEKLVVSSGLVSVEQVVAGLMRRCNEIADEELSTALHELDGIRPEQREAVQRLVRRLVSKLLHPPLSKLQDATESTVAAEVLKRLFDLK